MPSIETIRAKLLEKKANRSGKSSSSYDTGVFPFWKIETNETVNLRFIQDGNANNDYFWVTRELIKMPFAGIKGGDENKEVEVHVPCVEMWGDKCPVHDEIRPWFKSGDKDLEDLARVYWKKRTYIFQGFVRNSPLKEDEIPENPIRRFLVGPQVYNIIEHILTDPDVDVLPINIEKGLDFKLHKGQKGKHADYSASSWARNATALTQDERDAMDKFGIPDLSTYLPKRPTAEEISIIFDMFNASVAGELYDPERWGAHFKPKGVHFDDDGESKTNSSYEKRNPHLASSATEDTSTDSDDASSTDDSADNSSTVAASAPVTASAPTGQTTDDILAMIRNRER